MISKVLLSAFVALISHAALAQETPSAVNSALLVLTELKQTTALTAGLQSTVQDDESVVQVRLQNEALQIVDAEFGCHSDHCHAHSKSDRTDLSLPALSFSQDALISSLNQALDIFARKIAPVSQIQSVKIWQLSDEVYVTLTQDSGAAHFMCHVHGGDHFDCHRSRAAGPQEPQW